MESLAPDWLACEDGARMPEPDDKRVADAVWPWRDRPEARGQGANAVSLRRHGLLRAALGLAVALALWLLHWRDTALVAAAVSGSMGLLAAVSPTGASLVLQRALDAAARAVGQGVTVLLLVPIYFLVFTPFGLLARRGARDPLQRTWSSAAPTFWTERVADTDPAARRKRPF